MIFKGKLVIFLSSLRGKTIQEVVKKFNENPALFVEIDPIWTFDSKNILFESNVGKIKNMPLQIIDNEIFVEIELNDNPMIESFKEIIEAEHKKIIPYQIFAKHNDDGFIKSFIVLSKESYVPESSYDIEVIYG